MTGPSIPASPELPDPPQAPEPLGLIAGAGELPLLVAEGMRRLGHPVRCVGLAGLYDKSLPARCDRFEPVAALRLGGWGRKLRRMGVEHATMVGRVDKAAFMYDPVRIARNLPDWRTARVWYRRIRNDRRSAGLLAAVADELATMGVHLMDSTAHIPEHLASPGVMTRRRPTADQLADIEFGWPILMQVVSLDIGQSIAVRERDCIAVEAIEGTDRMIMRVGELCRTPGWTMLKAARAGHDRRADVPTVGEMTIRNLHRAGGRTLALAAGDVIIVRKEETLDLADRLGVAVVGVEPDGSVPR